MKSNNVGVVVLVLLAIAAAAGITRPTRTEPIKPCGELRPVAIGGSMIVGCR